jgi:hypothetical protein
MASNFAAKPAMAFDEYKTYVEFRFDGDLHMLLHGEEYITSFEEIFTTAMANKKWDWYTGSIIHIYK